MSNTADLTEKQREALLVAYEQGWFDVPRRISTTEVAENVGISRQAVSERLRRGMVKLADQELNNE